ncbi:MAG: bifunctional fucokinase/L-fucose-1-P-guanylyltransferase [Clostridia bacterium]|nr:bifunctional fucokinase/L-fucose-1-P-guanylyltransferase [Clostridia bacterium]
MANQYASLFQQQSYQDAWATHSQTLAGNFPVWDYIILTASNEDQAQAYREQIAYRLKGGYLPDKTHYAVIPDRDGLRVGSGGATFGVIHYVHEHAGTFRGKRLLVIHSGGDSKRVPQYSACGKLFSPVPRLLPDGRRSTLFDEFIIGMSGVAARISEGMLVCSGDVLLLFNPLQIDFYSKGAAALSIKENVQTGKDHGVWLKGAGDEVQAFLHKQSVETLMTRGAVDERGNVDIDTGSVIFDANMLESLWSLIDTDEKYNELVSEQARLSFYADFQYPLSEEATLEQFYREKPEGDFTPELRRGRELLWEALRPYRMKLIRLAPASFIHFGTSGELRSLMADAVDGYGYLGWSRRVNCNCDCQDFAASNSYISPRAAVGPGAYVEDSYIHRNTVVGEGCIISGVTLDGQTVPDGAVLHGLKLRDGRFVVRMYAVGENPKEPVIFGKALDRALWDAPIYPVCGSIREAVDATLAAYAAGFPGGEGCLSLKDSFNQADTAAIIDWQERLDDKIKVESLLAAIDARQPLRDAVRVFRGSLTARAERMLLREAERLDEGDLAQFGRKIRIHHALSMLTGREEHASACFDTIRRAVLVDAVAGLEWSAETRIVEDEVTVRLPVRVNWGGGWSDTPPYCMEHGGTVLNAAISLNGELPVEAVVRRAEKGRIILTSADNGAYQEFTDIEMLQDSSNPYDPFALHKAALIACGVIPYKEKISVQEITGSLGGGVYLSTQVMGIPRGSGLGTSSILAGACVKALMKFLGRQLTENELYNRVLCMEQIMSTGGGWQDQVGGLAPGIKMVTSEPGIHQEVTCIPLRMTEAAKAELNERFCLIYTGQRRLARNLLREVVGRYVASHPDAVEVLEEIQRMAVLMRYELEKGNIDGFARLLSAHWEQSRKLDGGCTNTCIDQLFLAIDDLIDGRMICGAGGGGFLQVVLKKGVTADMLQERLYEVFQDSGACVWTCALV